MEKLVTDQPIWSKVSEVELVYKTKVKPSQRPQIQSSKDGYRILTEFWNMDRIEMQEEFKVLLLNHSNKVTGVFEASSGGITSTIADIRLIMAVALKSLAVSIIIAHNHPSGRLIPSKADEELTAKVKEAGRYLDIKVLDHLIISSEGYFSFADEGLV